ncbi:phosphoenolpyruvate phosphomutase-domain-containing protein [Neohortaea acidophila]|uniref:Phosphoenolpyruvate phosphomutase-domain-containing protein n=1 Tax=Neohortaea acidophila TaxID=245834 RepID=A0A6A6Q5K5_9PEZI|nr:phosphoenolpyruvate phosphomutase-domain-containing protein [Neohortaea acidophila]KAF2487572.1 phosphoenolpyruvate phosphomutase-domain-containing protein [Neohortaea acidophila]
MASQNDKARKLRALCKPGDPLVLTNVWDPPTAKIVSQHPRTQAVATASYALAAVIGIEDDDLSLEDNLAAVRRIAAVLQDSEIPLSADMQDGYGDVAETVKQFIAAGAVGGNLEDVDNAVGELRGVSDAVSRVVRAREGAREAGVPDFCINARTDVLRFGGNIGDAIARGRAYLQAGATTVYVWGGPKGRGVSREEIWELVKGLGGMINVKMNLRPGFLTRKELAELGVARISIGPELYARAMDGFKGALEKAVDGQSFE